MTDLQYGATLSPAVVLEAGDYPDLTDAVLVIITAGINEKAGGATDRSDPAGRLRLLKANAEIYRDIIPNVVKAGGDGMQSADVLKGGGFPAVDGWYATVASPHFDEGSNAKAKAFAEDYFKKFKEHPDDYTVTCYVGAEVIIQAVKDLVKAKKSVDRNSVRDAIQHVDLKDTLIGPVQFDANGDLKNKVISVFKITKDDKAPLDDPTAQYKYIGTAPMS